jgi:hypothetical protein
LANTGTQSGLPTGQEARSVHRVLVSGAGHRVGFQFTGTSDGSVDVVRSLLT